MSLSLLNCEFAMIDTFEACVTRCVPAQVNRQHFVACHAVPLNLRMDATSSWTGSTSRLSLPVSCRADDMSGSYEAPPREPGGGAPGEGAPPRGDPRLPPGAAPAPPPARLGAGFPFAPFSMPGTWSLLPGRTWIERAGLPPLSVVNQQILH